MARLRSERELTVVVVLHDLAAAARVADRVALFHRGRLYGCAAAPEALAADALRDVFGVAARWVEGASGCRRLEIEGLADPERRL